MCLFTRLLTLYLFVCFFKLKQFNNNEKKKVRSAKITRINTKHKGFLNMERGVCEGAGVGAWGREGLFLLEAQDKFLFYLQ